jgi:hypothetical protein
MARCLRVSFLLILLALGAAPARAALLGDASIAYSAERTVTVNGKSYTGMVFHTPGHDRHEQAIEGIDEVIILDADAKRGFLIVPGLGSYVAFGFPPLMAELDDASLRGTPVGRERVAGLDTTKYRIDHWAADGSHAEGHVWLSGKGVLVRIDGTVTRKNSSRPMALHMELANLAIGPQDRRLFTLPPGLLQLPARALEGLLGGKRG